MLQNCNVVGSSFEPGPRNTVYVRVCGCLDPTEAGVCGVQNGLCTLPPCAPPTHRPIPIRCTPFTSVPIRKSGGPKHINVSTDKLAFTYVLYLYMKMEEMGHRT